MTNRSRLKLVSNLIVIISLFFLLLYLVRSRLLALPQVIHYHYLAFSLLLLLAAFFMDALTIRLFMRSNAVLLPPAQAIVLTGKYSLAKYIPGKIGVILGKAAYVAEHSAVGSYRALEMVSVYQVLFLMSAAILSVLTLSGFLKGQSEQLLFALLALLLLSGLLLLKRTQLILRSLMRRAFKLEIRETYSARSILIVLAGTMCCWLLWVMGFQLLAWSSGTRISLNAALLFPLATIAGVVAVITPGGIGVKETVISAGMVFYGHSRTDAVSLGVYSRLWFLLGEVLFFLLALFVAKKLNNGKEQRYHGQDGKVISKNENCDKQSI